MKKLVIVSFVLLLSLASCAKRYTCPTYLKDNTSNEDVRVQNDLPTEEDAKKLEESRN